MQCIQISILSPSIWPASSVPGGHSRQTAPWAVSACGNIRHCITDRLCIRSGRLAGATGDGENIFHLTTEGVSD